MMMPATTRSILLSIFLTITVDDKAAARVNKHEGICHPLAFKTPSEIINDKRTADKFPYKIVTSMMQIDVGIIMQMLYADENSESLPPKAVTK